MEKTDITLDNEVTGDKPDNFVFIIGAMKSGTTSLFEVLSQHPQICPSKTKEPDYFVEDRDKDSKDEYLSLWDWQSSTHSIALESSVAYTKSPFITGVPERIQQEKLGQYRFIYILRNPLTRIESQLRHGLFAGWGKSLDAEIPEDAIHFSSYATQLDKYLQIFPKKSIMLLTLEEFKLSPHLTLARICQFLEIDNTFEFQDAEKTRNSGGFFNAPASVAHITQNSFAQFISRNILPAKVKLLLRNFIAKQFKDKSETTSSNRWQLTPDERIFILNRLADDLKRLEADFGIDIQKYWQIQTNMLNKLD